MNEFLASGLALLIKQSLIVLICQLLAVGFSHFGYAASARHRLWLSGFLCLSLLPATAALLPQLTLAVSYAQIGLASTDLSMPGVHHPNRSIAMWGQGIWLLGTVIMVGHLALSRAALFVLWRSAKPLPAPTVAECAKSVGVKRGAVVRVSASAVGPLTWGSYVLLPNSAQHWPDRQLRDVLVHEFSHIARRDSQWLMLAMLVRAAFWFNPAVWFAVRQLRKEQELACDERVLSSGTDAVHYAQSLLAIAAGIGRPLAVHTTSAMAMRTDIEIRVRQLLGPVSSRAMGLLGMSCLLAAIAVAGATIFSVRVVDSGMALAPLGSLGMQSEGSAALPSLPGLAPLSTDSDIPDTRADAESR